MRWYYVVNGEVVGPVRTHYLSRILKQGLIHNKTYVYNKEVLKDWTRIKNVLELIKNLTKEKKKDSERSSNYPTRSSNVLRYNRERNKSKGKNKADQEERNRQDVGNPQRNRRGKKLEPESSDPTSDLTQPGCDGSCQKKETPLNAARQEQTEILIQPDGSGKRHRKRKRRYLREKAKRKHEKAAEPEEIEEVVEDQSEGSSSEEEQTEDTIDVDPALPAVDIMPLKNGDWIETLNGQIGRVLYIGPVKGIPGEALGIELSKPEGDCDGSFDGHRYFQCKKSHGQFLNKRLIKQIVMDPSYTQESPYQAVIDDLNLQIDFDAVSLGLAVTALGYSFGNDDIFDAWQSLHTSNQRCKTAADQLEILIGMLEEPMLSMMMSSQKQDSLRENKAKQETEFNQVQRRWRRFSQLHSKKNVDDDDDELKDSKIDEWRNDDEAKRQSEDFSSYSEFREDTK